MINTIAGNNADMKYCLMELGPAPSITIKAKLNISEATTIEKVTTHSGIKKISAEATPFVAGTKFSNLLGIV